MKVAVPRWHDIGPRSNSISQSNTSKLAASYFKTYGWCGRRRDCWNVQCTSLLKKCKHCISCVCRRKRSQKRLGKEEAGHEQTINTVSVLDDYFLGPCIFCNPFVRTEKDGKGLRRGMES